jgi:predicted Zn-ribbon and HTH transcriptional regulator
MELNVKRFECRCRRCGWLWLSREKHPIACAHCKSPYWAKDPVIKKGTEATAATEITSVEGEADHA